MLDAFRELGFEVLTVTGSARERSRRLRALRARLEGGQSIEFLYSECATIPTMLTEPRHLPPHLLLDPSLMRLVRRHGVPTSLFYRDIYWVFPDYRQRVGAAVAGAMSLVYRYDLAWYSRYIRHSITGPLMKSGVTVCHPALFFFSTENIWKLPCTVSERHFLKSGILKRRDLNM